MSFRVTHCVVWGLLLCCLVFFNLSTSKQTSGSLPPKWCYTVLVGLGGIEKNPKHLFVWGIPATRGSIQHCWKCKTQLPGYIIHFNVTEAATPWSALSRKRTTAYFSIVYALQQLTLQMPQFFASVPPLWSLRLQYLSVDFVSERILPLLLSESQNIISSFTSHFIQVFTVQHVQTFKDLLQELVLLQ